MKIKLCGLFRPEDIVSANESGPDFVGFVFADSRRKVSPETAALLRRGLRQGIRTVGVFVDTPPDLVVRCLEETGIEVAQLHGRESEEELRYIRAATGKQVIKAVKVHNRAEVEAWLNSAADYLLFDSGSGTGETFDWRILEGVSRDFFLAGGLNLGNLEQACLQVRPFCVDVSSGAETEGIKDPVKMSGLVRLAHGLP